MRFEISLRTGMVHVIKVSRVGRVLCLGVVGTYTQVCPYSYYKETRRQLVIWTNYAVSLDASSSLFLNNQITKNNKLISTIPVLSMSLIFLWHGFRVRAKLRAVSGHGISILQEGPLLTIICALFLFHKNILNLKIKYKNYKRIFLLLKWN